MVALRNLVSAHIVDEYPPLADIRGSYVAQVHFLFCVTQICIFFLDQKYTNLYTQIFLFTKKISSLCAHRRAPQPPPLSVRAHDSASSDVQGDSVAGRRLGSWQRRRLVRRRRSRRKRRRRRRRSGKQAGAAETTASSICSTPGVVSSPLRAMTVTGEETKNTKGAKFIKCLIFSCKRDQ